MEPGSQWKHNMTGDIVILSRVFKNAVGTTCITYRTVKLNENHDIRAAWFRRWFSKVA